MLNETNGLGLFILSSPPLISFALVQRLLLASIFNRILWLYSATNTNKLTLHTTLLFLLINHIPFAHFGVAVPFFALLAELCL